MSSFIEHAFTTATGNQKLEPVECIQAKNDAATPQFFVEVAAGKSMQSESLPWEILETAYFFFLRKGFEKTTIRDICGKLDIKPPLFYNHFDSLDEVLETLWAM